MYLTDTILLLKIILVYMNKPFILFGIILLVFGVGKLPQVGGAIGKGIREFRKGHLGEDTKEIRLAEGKRRTTNQNHASKP